MTIDPQRVQAIFLAALAATDAEARRALLDRECGNDLELRQRVENLLSADAATRGFDAAPSGNSPIATMDRRHTIDAGSILAGRYKLIEAIGEGGMGSVWVAEQKEPVKRKVAIKLIKPGMDSKQVLARFEAERQALALMDHPNIAKVFDGGMTDQGRPFFVMEYVKGVPLTEYCDQARMSLRARLQLFIPVCQAVQHAHQKGIIHRDLKPSNILICLYDGKPVPKVIDFGLAKAMHHSLTEQSLYTAHGMMVGTPLYMSPEQAEHNNLDVDTRTDIYSLGVILYELLTGTTPLEGQQLKEAAYNEILRLIKEVEPPKPSTRISGSVSLPSIAAQRSIEPNHLKKSLTGDLDWIVMKALDKERSRRYETANGLSRDVERFLNDEAVEACPPSTAYRLKKFLHRNHAMVSAVITVAIAMVLGMIAFGWQASVARHQRDLANIAGEAEAAQRRIASEERDRAIEAQKKEAEQRRLAETARVDAESQKRRALDQEAEAKKQAAIAEAVAKFQTDMLAAVDPNQLRKDPTTNEPLRDTVTVLQVMQAAIKTLDEGSLKDQPLVEAGLRDTIGLTLSNLARSEEAEPNLRRALEIHKANLPAGNLKIAHSMNNLALLLQMQNKSVEAEQLFRKALEIFRSKLPPGHRMIAASMSNLASELHHQNRVDEAETLAREALTMHREAVGDSAIGISYTLDCLVRILITKGQWSEAEQFLREELAIQRTLLPVEHPNIAAALFKLALTLENQYKRAEAEKLYRESLSIRRRSLAARHPDIAASLNGLGYLLTTQSRLSEAEPLLREALEIHRQAYPAGHVDISNDLQTLAILLMEQNRYAESETLFREALEIRRKTLARNHPNTLETIDRLATLLLRQGKFSEAESLFREALEAKRLKEAMPHSLSLSLNNLADALRRQQKLDEAEQVFREAVAVARTDDSDHGVLLARVQCNLAALLQEQHKLAEAERLFRESLQILREVLPERNLELATVLNNFADLRVTQNELAEAESLYREAVEVCTAAFPQGHPSTLVPMGNLASLYAKLGKSSEANEAISEWLKCSRKYLPEESPQLANQLASAGLFYMMLQQPHEAEPLIREALKIRESKEPDSWKKFGAYSLLGGVLLEQKMFAEAEPLLLAGYEGMKQRKGLIPRIGQVRFSESLQRLATLYAQWHAAEPDKGYDVKAAEWKAKLEADKTSQN